MKANKKILGTKERGITLIALVITIIVLLILAGVSIAMLTGQNGILTQAQKAKNETEDAAQNEANILDSYQDIIYDTITEVSQVEDNNPGVLEGSGTEEDPYTISSVEDFVVFSDNVTKGNTYQNQYVELKQSLDFKSNKSYVNSEKTDFCGYEGELKTELTEGKGFITIGTTEEKPFMGEFNGNGNSIIGLTIKSENENQGLFCNNEGIIKNLNIINSKISGNYTVGSIASINKGEILNCLSQGVELTTKLGECGGICGKSNGKIEGCVNKSDITGIGSIGGIAAVNITEGEVLSCYNIGNICVSENSSNVGGIV